MRYDIQQRVRQMDPTLNRAITVAINWRKRKQALARKETAGWDLMDPYTDILDFLRIYKESSPNWLKVACVEFIGAF